MYTQDQNRCLTRKTICSLALAALGATVTFSLGWAGQDSTEASSEVPEPISTEAEIPLPDSAEPEIPPADSNEMEIRAANSIESHIPEAIRSGVTSVVVISGQSPPSGGVTGTYEKSTLGLIDGMEAGSRMGTIEKEIGGVPVHFPIPGLGIPGAIWGAFSGATKRQIQELRDRLTEEIAREDNPPLVSNGLALDVFWGIRKLPNIESQLFAPKVEIPSSTDAVLYVSLNDLTIDVQGKQAIMTATAAATLRRLSDNQNVYETVIQYQDRDTLGNWTENENELWRDFTNFARFYLGREISADVFDRVEIDHELRPIKTDSLVLDKKNKRKFNSRAVTPTLAWELKLKGGDPNNSWTESIGESNIFYDIEIFDAHKLVYYEEQIPDPRHVVSFGLEACQTYRWSVRPSYHVDGAIKFGDWMKFRPDTDGDTDNESENKALKGLFGRIASESAAYTQDFAVLEIACAGK